MVSNPRSIAPCNNHDHASHPHDSAHPWESLPRDDSLNYDEDFELLWPVAWDEVVQNLTALDCFCDGDAGHHNLLGSSQSWIATGYMFFERLYFANNTFALMDSHKGNVLDAER